MNLLLTLTLIYVAILVVALAASLIAIWIYLLRVGRHLGQVGDALRKVEKSTQPLEGPLQLLQTISIDTARDLDQSKENLSKASQHLPIYAGQDR